MNWKRFSAGLLRPLLDQDLSIVFYDLTTLRLEGESTVAGELRHYGRAKEGTIARQCLLGVVQTADGLPIYHEVFAGHTAETTTLVPTIQRVLARFPIRRVIVVADRGLLSLDNLDELQQIRIGEQPLEFILAVPGRRYAEFQHPAPGLPRHGLRQGHRRSDRGSGLAGFPFGHRPSSAGRGRAHGGCGMSRSPHWKRRPPSGPASSTDKRPGPATAAVSSPTAGVMARFHQAVSEAKLSRILRVDLSSPLFTYHLDEDALALARMMDGKLLLVTNVSDLTPARHRRSHH